MCTAVPSKRGHPSERFWRSGPYAPNGNARHPQATNGGGNRVPRTLLAEPDRAMPGKPMSDRRLNLYIDGHNFYVPLSRSGKESDYELAWCNFQRLGEH